MHILLLLQCLSPYIYTGQEINLWIKKGKRIKQPLDNILTQKLKPHPKSACRAKTAYTVPKITFENPLKSEVFLTAQS